MIEKIKKIISDDNYIYGIRVDDYNYEIGDTCHISHELFQDAQYDDNDNLLYPYCEDGIYKGYYDAGELKGTCAIAISGDNIENALKQVKMYFGEHVYIIKGTSYEDGNDINEIIIENAIVIAKFDAE